MVCNHSPDERADNGQDDSDERYSEEDIHLVWRDEQDGIEADHVENRGDQVGGRDVCTGIR